MLQPREKVIPEPLIYSILYSIYFFIFPSYISLHISFIHHFFSHFLLSFFPRAHTKTRNFSKSRGIQGYIRRLAPCFTLPSPGAYTESEPRNFSHSLSSYGGELGTFDAPEPLHRKKAIYDDWHLASLFQVLEPIQVVKLVIFPSPRAFTYFFIIPT